MTGQDVSRFATRCINAGEKLDEKGAMQTPLYSRSIEEKLASIAGVEAGWVPLNEASPK